MKAKAWGIARWLVFGILAIAFGGCGTGAGFGSERDWEPGRGALPERVGTAQAGDVPTSVSAEARHDGLHNELWRRLGYGEMTGRWFLHNGAGVFGYGLTSGTQRAGAEYAAELFAHDENGVNLDRDVRIALIERASDMTEIRAVHEEIIRVGLVKGQHRIFTGRLPDKENA
jgi:hypothetical protein